MGSHRVGHDWSNLAAASAAAAATDGQAGLVATTPESLWERRLEKPMPDAQADWDMGDGQERTENIGGSNLPLTTKLGRGMASVKDLSEN